MDDRLLGSSGLAGEAPSSTTRGALMFRIWGHETRQPATPAQGEGGKVQVHTWGWNYDDAGLREAIVTKTSTLDM